MTSISKLNIITFRDSLPLNFSQKNYFKSIFSNGGLFFVTSKFSSSFNGNSYPPRGYPCSNNTHPAQNIPDSHPSPSATYYPPNYNNQPSQNRRTQYLYNNQTNLPPTYNNNTRQFNGSFTQQYSHQNPSTHSPESFTYNSDIQYEQGTSKTQISFSSISLWPLCIFNEDSMLMIKPKPALFEPSSSDQNRFFLANLGSLEISFSTRLPNARQFDKATRQTVYISPDHIGGLLVPLTSLVSSSISSYDSIQKIEASSSVKVASSTSSASIPTSNNSVPSYSNSNATSTTASHNPELWTETISTSQKGTQILFKIQGKNLRDTKISFTLQTSNNRTNETSNTQETTQIASQNSIVSLSQKLGQSSNIEVILKSTEYLTLQNLLQACLPSLFGWQFTSHPSSILQFLKK